MKSWLWGPLSGWVGVRGVGSKLPVKTNIVYKRSENPDDKNKKYPHIMWQSQRSLNTALTVTENLRYNLIMSV